MFCKAKSAKKNNFFLRGDLDHILPKNDQFWDQFFQAFFPKDSKSLKILDIRLQEVGAKKASKYTTWKGTSNRHTDTQTDIATTRSNRPSGPIRWKWNKKFSEDILCAGQCKHPSNWTAQHPVGKDEILVLAPLHFGRFKTRNWFSLSKICLLVYWPKIRMSLLPPPLF